MVITVSPFHDKFNKFFYELEHQTAENSILKNNNKTWSFSYFN